MKKLLTLLAITAAFSLLPSISQAVCVSTGTITRMFVPAGGATSMSVRGSAAGSVLFSFSTVNFNIINAALAAESSHITVSIIGDAPSCVVGPGGFVNGGNVISIGIG